MMQLNDVYQRDDFIKFLEEDFLTDFKRDIRPVNTSSLTCINKAQYLGESKILDLQVFEFVFEGSANKRVALTKDAFSVMRSSAIYNALAVFHTEDNKDWRFSLLTATPEPTEKGKVSLTYSNPKRLSFFLGPNAKINTPTKFLISKGKIVDFEDLKSRFSIEVVNKEFYKEISQAFTKLVSGLLKLPSIQDKSQTNLEFAVRLIGRIIFCWFLREKKSEAGLSLMPKELLSIEAMKEYKDYYHTILEPIFFEVLNKPVKSRRDEFAKGSFSSVPYLNGGLFSPQEDDFYKRMNSDFQSQFHNTLVIPDTWLNSFFEILETYNFTIDENTSYDEELSIDPEMLGRIFENLLAEINPETGESARKSTGSYYTPRTIVNYMVDESLLLYLKEQTGIKEEKLRAIISYDLSDDSENPVSTEEKEKIIEALEKVKILDPACGSGAFPIGALQKIVFILQQTDPDGQLWFKKQIKNTAPEVKRVIEREFEHKNFDYIRKLGIIRENIYGVDIQAIATEISRLRCFLTLIVDERIQDGVENRGIEPLPNLDFKFVTANSLIGLPKIDLSQQSMFDDYQKIDDLKNIRDQYFNAAGIEREQLKTEFVTQQKRLVDQLIKEHGFMGVAKAELTQKLTDWEPFTHKSTSWFDAEWMFGIKDGFDILIANPPYVGEKNNKDLFRSLYISELGKRFHQGKMDLFYYFFHLAIDNLKQNGSLAFITTNYFITATGALKLREDIQNRTTVLNIVNFNELKVFESALGQHNMITILQKGRTTKPVKIVVTKMSGYLTDEKLVNILNGTDENTNYFTVSQSQSINKESFKLTFSPVDEILDKLASKFPKLGKSSTVEQGLQTGFNKLFIVNRNNLPSEWTNAERKLLYPFYKGSDLHKYLPDYEYNSVVLYLDKSIKDLSDYPNVLKYLSKFRKELESRAQIKRSHQLWFTLLWPRDKAMFTNPKISTSYRSVSNTFSYIEREWFSGTDTYHITKSSHDLIFLTGLLNSRLIFKWLFHRGARKGNILELNKDNISLIPIPEKNSSNLTLIEDISKLTKNILKKKKSNIDEDVIVEEAQINLLVYKLYELLPNEINLIEK